MPRLALGLDIGGTEIKGLLLTEHGKAMARGRRASCLSEGPERVAANAMALALDLVADASVDMQEVAGMGVAIAAYIYQDGVIRTGIKAGRWEGVDFGVLLREHVNLPMMFAIDVAAAVIGEAVYGRGRWEKDLICLTVGTGIGAGVMFSRRLVLGGWVCGVGHHTVIPEGGPSCECGNTGCLETLCSTRALVRLGRDAVSSGRSAVLTEMCGGDPSRLTASHVISAAKAGDPAAVAAAAECGRWLGLGLSNLLAVLGPVPIAVGGGLSVLGDLLLQPARDYVRTHSFPTVNRTVWIERGLLGEYVGCYGAAAMLFQNIRISFDERIGSDIIQPVLGG